MKVCGDVTSLGTEGTAGKRRKRWVELLYEKRRKGKRGIEEDDHDRTTKINLRRDFFQG